jgi:hypothetical protein
MAADSAGQADQFVRDVQRALRGREQLFAGAGQAHAARGALEQHHAELFVQLLELQGKRGLGQVQALRRARKIAFPRQGDEGPDQVEVHGWILALQISSASISHWISPRHRAVMGDLFPNRTKGPP